MRRYGLFGLVEHRSARPVPRGFLPYLLLSLVLVVYLGSVSDFLTYDSIAYATSAIKSPLRGQLNPHHLVYSPVLSLLLHILGAAAPDQAALRILQLANLAVSAAAVCVFFLLLREITVSALAAYLLSGVLAFANAFWAYAFQIEVYNWTILLVLFSIYALLREPAQPCYRVLGPIALTTAMLFHQTAIILALAVAAAFLWHNAHPGVAVRYAMIPILVTVIIYVAAAGYAGQQLTLSNLWRFATAYAHEGMWGAVRATNYQNSAYGFVNSIVSIETEGRRRIAVLALLSGTVFLGIRVRAVSTYLRRTLRSSWSPVATLALIWFALHGLFVWWWDPGNPEFWILALPALLILVAVLTKGDAASQKAYRTAALMLSAVLLLELSLNSLAILENRTTNNTAAALAREIATKVGPQDVLLIVGEGPPDAYLAYYCSCRVVKLRYLRSTNQVETDEVIARLTVLFDQTRARQGRVFVHSDLVTGDPTKLQLYDLLSLDVPTFRGWLRSYEWTQHRFGDCVLFELVSQAAT